VQQDAPAGASCGDDSDTECTDPDTCDGSGACQDNHAAEGTACGDDTDTDCTDPDTCDGFGACQDNQAAEGTACGDGSDTDCTDPDTCDGFGACQDNQAANGTACGDGSDTDCTDPDTCDGFGACLGNHVPDGTACVDCTVAPCIGCVGGQCYSSEYDLDVGPFGSDYAQPAQTRGYWFTAPVAFTITALRVPTDVGTEVQNIEVVRFNSAIPIYPTWTTDFVSLAYFQGVAGTSYVAVNIPVQAGDVIGVLGARGTATMHSSYGTTNTYASAIFGQPVTLNRLRMDANLNTAQATQLATDTTTTWYYGRVELKYTY